MHGDAPETRGGLRVPISDLIDKLPKEEEPPCPPLN